MKAQSEFLSGVKLYQSEISPCPYLPDQQEEQAFMLLDQEQLALWSDRLNRVGFRRSMNSLYVPVCRNCKACQSVRLEVKDFCIRKSHRKLFRRNQTFRSYRISLEATVEGFDLFKRYLASRHEDSDMNEIDEYSYRQLLEVSPKTSFALCLYDREKLIGKMIVDRFSDGFSAVYSFFDPDYSRHSLGIYLILELVRFAQIDQVPYLYLGYYVKESPKMSYKAQFQPLQIFDWRTTSWECFSSRVVEDI